MSSGKRPSDLWGTAFATAQAEAMRAYDEILVPAFFELWAKDLVDRVAPDAAASALDVACGPGSVTRVLAARVGPLGSVTGADISPAMLAIARSKPAAPEAAPISWILSPAAPLALADDSFDALTCQQGLQFFPDKLQALSEMRRALRPTGRGAVSFWTRIEEQPTFEVLRDALGETVSDDVATRYTGAWSLGRDEGAQIAEAAGFRVRVETVTLPLRMEGGARALFETLVASGVAADVSALDDDRVDSLIASIGRRAAPLLEDGAIVSTMTSTILLLS